jgi:plasmid maintenance system antidote protein VapI
MNNFPFGYSIHPGAILKTEFMEPLGLSSYRLAKDLHVSAPRVNDIVLGKRGPSLPVSRCASAPILAAPPSSG